MFTMWCNFYLLSSVGTKIWLCLTAPPTLPFNIFSKSRNRVLWASPPFNFSGWTISGGVIWSGMVSCSVGKGLETILNWLTIYHNPEGRKKHHINLKLTSMRTGAPSFMAIWRASWTAVYIATASCPSTRILRIPYACPLLTIPSPAKENVCCQIRI